MEAPDRELMQALARGEREALVPLMERHYRRLYRLALAYLRDPVEALDCVQETFVKALQNATRWNPEAEAGAWLTRIAVNDAIDRCRRVRRRRTRTAGLGGEMADGEPGLRAVAPEPSPEQRLADRERAQRVGAALSVLTPRQRAVVVLRHYEDRPLAEIAGILGLRLGTVKSSLHRALGRLRQRLAGDAC